MSEAINKAIIAAAKEIGSLRKGEQNAHGGYAYVPIDSFYELAAPKILANGLTWKIREIASEMIEVQGRQRMENAVRTTYEVDLMHENGELMQGFFRATITHPLQGAQTAGSSMSYLDKLFIRTTFHVVTGEKDADATDNAVFDLGPAPARSGASRGKGQTKPKGSDAEQDPFDIGAPKGGGADAPAEPVADVGAFIALATEFVSLAKSDAELTKYWNDNEGTFLSLKAEDPKAYSDLIASFRERKKQLKGAEA